MGIEIRRAVEPEELDACMRVRMQVFVDEQGVPAEDEPDALDAEAVHFLVADEGRVIGTARFVSRPDGVAKIGRVALLPHARGRGIGRDLMWYVMGAAFPAHHTLNLDAQVPVIPFYERLGFQAEGPVFLDAGIDHRRMTCHR